MRRPIAYSLACALLLGGALPARGVAADPAEPGVKDPASFDPKRPMAQELQTRVPDGFTAAAVGDLIISRPLTPRETALPAFHAALERLRHATVAFGNMETSIFDARGFAGSPYPWDGDWAVAAVPAAAADLRAMGIGIVARANNHALDWGLEGMRETGRRLDEAGIVHAGAGESRGAARSPRYLETPGARVALVSFASTFRPTTEAEPPQGAAPGRPGISALHLAETIELPPEAMKSLAALDCTLHGHSCQDVPADLEMFGKKFHAGARYSHEYAMDPEDLAEIYRSIRAARQNADFVIVAVHTHECSIGCDDGNVPYAPGHFLRGLAHGAVDAGADLFVATGNHNLGPVEIYDSPGRGRRPIFYGLGDFFWSDVQELMPHELFQANAAMLAKAWVDPSKATEYDLTAPLNAGSFAGAYAFQSVIAECRFEGNRLARVELRPVDGGYGRKLTDSGIPQLVTDPALADAILGQIREMNASYGLPELPMKVSGGVAVIRP